MIRFKCPHCGKAISVKDEGAEKKGKCPGCGEIVQVPKADVQGHPKPAGTMIPKPPICSSTKPKQEIEVIDALRSQPPQDPTYPQTPPTTGYQPQPIVKAPVPVAVQVNVNQSRAAHSLGIASLVLGIISFFVCWIPFIGFGLGGLGLVLGVAGLILAIVRKGSGIGYSIAGTAVSSVAVIIGIFFMLLFSGPLALPAIQAAREAARRAQCLNNLKQIGLAMQNSESALRRFPSAYGDEKPGGPQSSWRVHLLPFMGQVPLYDQYDFESAWDDPMTNLTLADIMPQEYRCPSDSNTSIKETSYVAIVGPNTAMPAGGKIGVSDIPDGSFNTLLIVEKHNSGITWTEPRDLDAAKLNYKINRPGGAGLQGPHPGIINVGMCDGSVHSISEDIDPTVLKAMTTRDGGEDVGYSW